MRRLEAGGLSGTQYNREGFVKVVGFELELKRLVRAVKTFLVSPHPPRMRSTCSQYKCLCLRRGKISIKGSEQIPSDFQRQRWLDDTSGKGTKHISMEISEKTSKKPVQRDMTFM